MTLREREILDWIRKHPMISQIDLAKELNITRSSVAVHISNLIKKGFIKGKGYVLTEGIGDVIVVGGANIDLTGHINNSVSRYDSNPGVISTTFGGVGRNIAENLVRLGIPVKLITAIGDDYYGDRMIKHCEVVGIDMSLSKRYIGERTSVYMQVLNQIGDLDVAVADMQIVERLTKKVIVDYDHYLDSAKAIVVDCNVSASVIQYLSEHFGEKLFIDPVSVVKSKKIKSCFKSVFCITPNRYELTELASGDNIEEMIHDIIKQGVDHVVVTEGSEGVTYYNKKLYKKEALPARIENVTGAGDAFVAGLVYGFVNEKNFEQCVDYGLKMAKMTVECKTTVNENISDRLLEA